jgi:hypothetical protein
VINYVFSPHLVLLFRWGSFLYELLRYSEFNEGEARYNTPNERRRLITMPPTRSTRKIHIQNLLVHTPVRSGFRGCIRVSI